MDKTSSKFQRKFSIAPEQGYLARKSTKLFHPSFAMATVLNYDKRARLSAQCMLASGGCGPGDRFDSAFKMFPVLDFDIWRDRCDRWLCKILVSSVNFQKTSATVQQFTQSWGHIWCMKSMHMSNFLANLLTTCVMFSLIYTMLCKLYTYWVNYFSYYVNSRCFVVFV